MDDASVAESLENYEAISAINFYLVPHYNSIPFKGAVNKIIKEYNDNIPLVAISNNQAVIIENDGKRTITKGVKFLFISQY